MAYITPQELQYASADAKTLGKFSNDLAGVPNVNRIGNDVENMMTLRQRMLDAASDVANRKPYLTYAQMVADTSQPVDTPARVETGTGAGDYIWNGSAWVLSDVQAASALRVNPLLRVSQSCGWLDASVLDLNGVGQLNWFVPAQRRVEGALAIKSVRPENEDEGEQYTIAIFCNQDPVYRDRIAIGRVSTNSIVLDTGAIDIVRNPSGLTRVVIGDTQNDAAMRVILDIDYRQLTSTGVLHTGLPGVYWIAKTREADVWLQMAEKAMLPAWVRADYRNAVLGSADRWRVAASAIRGIWLDGDLGQKDYRVTVVAKDHATLGCRIFVGDGTGSVAAYQTTSAAPQGIETVRLSEFNDSGISGYATVNWSLITSAFLISNPMSNLVIDPDYPDPERAAQLVRQSGNIPQSPASVRPTAHPIRVAVGISSIPWGSGYLGQNTWVGLVEDFLRTRLATTIHADILAPAAAAISQPNMWHGSIRRISGAGAEVQFDSWGDELTVSFCRERGNAGAALVDLYVDGALFDTFSTYNDEPFGTATENLSGNGVDLKYPLARGFTYGHVVTVNGTPLVGGMNTQLSGATIPAGWDYMITRAYSVPLNAVVHQIWFRNAPSGPIVCSYSYGESITHMRGTLGNVGQGLDTTLESAFADGSVSEDTTQPASVSSGLGFRESDARACKTFILGEAKQRNFRLVVRELDPEATGSTPWLDLNFVTNRMHHVMNAGIGGWTVDLLLNSPILLNRIERLAEWGADLVLLESCTNDDWATHVSKGWVTRTGVTAQQLKDDESSNYYNAISGASPNKTVQDNRIPIAAVTATSVTLDMTNATVSAAPGDALIIGSFHGDHRRVATRLIDTYADGVVTFKRPISADEFAQADALSDLVGDWVMIKAAPTWATGLEQCVQVVKDQNPDCRIHIATAGQPNFNHRRLFGYREIGQALARQHGWRFVDLYEATGRFTYNQPQDARVYITNSQGTTATGASSYPLYLPNGTVPTAFLLRNPRIVVNGVDRTNNGVHIEGGYARTWASGITDPSLGNQSFQTKPHRLVFTDDVPPPGAIIEIYINTLTWSTDDTHPGRITYAAGGIPTFGVIAQQIVDALTIGVL